MDYKDNLGYLLHFIGFTMDRQSDLVLQERLDMGFSQFKILMVLRVGAGIQQRQIAERLGQTEASVSRQIKLLKDVGYITVKPSETNRREHITTLTSKGVRAVEKAIRALNDYHAPLFARFTPSQQQTLKELLNILHFEMCARENSASKNS